MKVVIGVVTGAFLLAGCGGATPVATTAASSQSPLSATTAASSQSPLSAPTASPPPSTPPPKSCSQWQSEADTAGMFGESQARSVKRQAEAAGCTGILIKANDAQVAANMGPITMNGVEWDWTPNPQCGYGSCFGITVTPMSQSCPNGVYAEINLLNGDGVVIGYSNDFIGSLKQGQKAKMTFQVTDNATEKAQLTKIDCS